MYKKQVFTEFNIIILLMVIYFIGMLYFSADLLPRSARLPRIISYLTIFLIIGFFIVTHIKKGEFSVATTEGNFLIWFLVLGITVLMNFIGFVIASIFFINIFSYYYVTRIKKELFIWKASLPYSIIVPIVIYVLFSTGLKITLPKICNLF